MGFFRAASDVALTPSFEGHSASLLLVRDLRCPVRPSACASGFTSFVLKRLPLAEQDSLDAAIWYEERRRGLREDFLDEIDHAVCALARDALLYRIRFADVRRAPVRRFK